MTSYERPRSTSLVKLRVGVANDVIPLFEGQTREFAGTRCISVTLRTRHATSKALAIN